MMKTKFIYISLSLLLFLFVNCSEDKISLSGEGTITGIVVTLGDNIPLENVKVSTNPSTSIVFTDAEGNFIIENVPVEDYSVQAEKVDYLTQFEGITMTDGATINVIFEMDVETANNRPPDAPVLITPEDNAIDQEIEVELIWSGSDPDDDDLTYTVSGLQYGLKYFWQVSASDDINEPTYSDVFTFETLPFPSNRHFFVRKINGNNVIFSGDDDGNEIQLTSSNSNSWRPRKANNLNKIAFLRTNGGVTHIYTMNLDGSDVVQVTNAVPVNGFNPEELDFSFRGNDTHILYPSFDKLYQIATSGASLLEIHQTLDGNFISEVDWNQQTSRIALKTNNSVGYNVSIYTINTSGVIQDMVLDNVNGAAGGLDYSFDGTKLLYTYDVSGNENTEYRQLDTNMFIYDLNTMTAENLSTGKDLGTNDLDARFSPSEAQVIFVNTSNDGVSQNDIYKIQIDVALYREVYIEDAKMPDWK